MRVDVNPKLLGWARERARIPPGALDERFPKLAAWEERQSSPTLRQLENFARATHTAVGLLLLPEPPDEHVPIPDFRTMYDSGIERPSADLLDIIFQSQQHQEWYRNYALTNAEGVVSFTGSAKAGGDVGELAGTIRKTLDFEIDRRGASWSEALAILIDHAENLGVLVMVSGIVGSNTRRKLDPKEFRGFALVDPVAPLVFVNGADTKPAQIFTLAHELVHVWIGQTALSDARLDVTPKNDVERWDNEVAAEILVPLHALRDLYDPNAERTAELERLARVFKVSTLVVLRRIHDAALLSDRDYARAYAAELERIMKKLDERGAGGGNFYNTLPARLSKRFTRAVLASTFEGQTLYRDAFRLLGFSKQSTFDQLAKHLGVA